jgi:hypothetical protein
MSPLFYAAFGPSVGLSLSSSGLCQPPKSRARRSAFYAPWKIFRDVGHVSGAVCALSIEGHVTHSQPHSNFLEKVIRRGAPGEYPDKIVGNDLQLSLDREEDRIVPKLDRD